MCLSSGGTLLVSNVFLAARSFATVRSADPCPTVDPLPAKRASRIS